MIYDNTLYFEDANGWASALQLDQRPTRLAPQDRDGGRGLAGSRHPTQARVLHAPVADPGTRATGNGAVVALSMKTGKVAWAHGLPSGSESSPLVHGLSVFLGDQGGTVYSFRTYDGHLNWTFRASGAVKGGVAFAHNTIYFGDYGGRVHAVNAANGGGDWSAAGGDTLYRHRRSRRAGYIGSTSGGVYAFWATRGRQAWTASTGAYVYASPAVADVPGVGPTVYIGSYDGTFYAYNANRWRPWSHGGGGRIDGSATVVETSSTLEPRTNTTSGSTAARVNSVLVPGRRVQPVITDGKVVFLIGYATIYQMVPKR